LTDKSRKHLSVDIILYLILYSWKSSFQNLLFLTKIKGKL